MNKFHIALTFIATILAAGPLSADAIPSAALAEQSSQRLMDMRRTLGLDDRHIFTARSFQTDALGQTHVRFQQYYQGVRVWGGEVITHVDSLGKELPVTASHRPNIDISVIPTLTGGQAADAVRKHLAPTGPYTAEPIVELVVYPEISREIRATRAQLATAELNATDMVSQVRRYVLAYYVHTELENPGETWHTDYLVNAHTGAIIDKWDSLQTSNAIGTGRSQYSGPVSLNTNGVAGGYELRDLTRPVSNGNVVYNLDHATSGTGTIYKDPDNTWGDGSNFKESPEPTTSANGQTAGVDAAFGIQATWDLFKNVFGRNGINGLGNSTYARVHYDNAYDNAFYSDQCMCITYGDGTKLQTLTALDIAAHEFAHGVCSTTAGLIYHKESGGLNEANSDIMGAMAEFYARGANGQGDTIPDTGGTWTQGEQVTTPAYPLKMRFLYKPSKDGKSADAWSPTLQDLDVHYSSGPMNRAFYFLSQGATTTGETSTPYLPQGMPGIGNDKAAKIWYRALTAYMTSTTDYVGARIANIQAVRDLFPVSGPEEIAVWNAFAGINVGSPWSGPDTPPTVTVNESGDKGTLTFSATASDDKGVVKVEFFLDGTLVGTATTAPYSMGYDSLMEDDGIHTLVARATDTTGQYTNATMTFALANGQLIRNGSFEKGYGVGWSNTPGIQIGAILGQTAFDGSKMAKFCGSGSRMSVGLYQSVAIPATPSSVTLSYALHIQTKETSSGIDHDTFAVQIRDPSGTILKTVATYSDRNAAAGYKVYSADLSAYKAQTIQLYFLGTEDAAVPTSFLLDQVNLKVAGGGNIDQQPPTIQVFETGSSGIITFSANATDNVGVSKVEFYVDNVIRGTVTSAPYTMSFDSRALSQGSHTLVGKAYDATGNVGTSTAVIFSVDNDIVDHQAPTIAVSASGTSGPITLSASATDNVGVTKVEFYVDGVIQGTVTNAPYTMTVDSATLANGNHTLLGKAYDAAGNVGNSGPVAFTVHNGGGGNDLILNGGFEQGSANWSGNGRIGSFSSQPAFEGSQCAWLGGKSTANASELFQTVTIPGTATSATLSYAVHVDTAEKSSWLRYDTAVVLVRNSAGTSVLKTLAGYSNLDKSAGYATKSFDLSAYKGQTLQIYIKGVEDSSYQTSFVFDKVRLLVQ